MAHHLAKQIKWVKSLDERSSQKTYAIQVAVTTAQNNLDLFKRGCDPSPISVPLRPLRAHTHYKILASEPS